MASTVIARISSLLARRRFRQGVAVLILLATLAVFVHFFSTHPEYWQQLRRLSPWRILIILAGNSLLLLILAGIYRTCIELCGKQISRRENFLLTAYSSIVNFFGPLQSGPGVRAVYLKAKLHIRLRDYTLATLLYYGLFACMNVFFLLVGTRPWWETSIVVLAAILFSLGVIRWFQRRDKAGAAAQFSPRISLIATLALLTLAQVSVQACIFYFELHTINPHIHFSQAVSYTGAADLAIFVALTPGAIGFRESFLVFSN